MSDETDAMMIAVAECLEHAGFRYTIQGGPSERRGFSLMQLRGLAVGVTNDVRQSNWYSVQLEACLHRSGFKVTRPFSDHNVLRVTR